MQIWLTLFTRWTILQNTQYYMFHRINLLLITLNKNLVRCHLLHKKLGLQSLQIFPTFKFNFIFILLLYGETWLIRPCSWIQMISNSHHLPVQSHHNNFRLALSNFFGECEKIQSRLHSIVATILQWVWVLSVGSN